MAVNYIAQDSPRRTRATTVSPPLPRIAMLAEPSFDEVQDFGLHRMPEQLPDAEKRGRATSSFWPRMFSSRSSGPLPEIIKTIGNDPCVDGKDKVPTSVLSAESTPSSCSYGVTIAEQYIADGPESDLVRTR